MAMNDLSKMALLLVLAIVPAAVAVTYTVGDALEWSSGTDYTTWVAGKTFRVGDTLVFKFSVIHSVDEVEKPGYDNCDRSFWIQNHFVSDTEIELNTVGRKYFICPTAGHCESGMKLAITVVAAAFSPPAPASPSPSPGEDSPPSDEEHEAGSTPPPPPSLPPPPTPSSGASSGIMSYVVIGISLVLASNAWIMD